ncbi:MAG TPA: hypothetical protein VF941_08420 [Clostridia bacterium]
MLKRILKGVGLIVLFVVILRTSSYNILQLETRLLYPFLIPSNNERILGAVIFILTVVILYFNTRAFLRLCKYGKDELKRFFVYFAVALVLFNLFISIERSEFYNEPPECTAARNINAIQEMTLQFLDTYKDYSLKIEIKENGTKERIGKVLKNGALLNMPGFHYFDPIIFNRAYIDEYEMPHNSKYYLEERISPRDAYWFFKAKNVKFKYKGTFDSSKTYRFFVTVTDEADIKDNRDRFYVILTQGNIPGWDAKRKTFTDVALIIENAKK